MSTNHILLDGIVLPQPEVKMNPLDGALEFGKGVFTTLLLEEGKLHFLEEHLQRLQRHCQRMCLDPFVFHGLEELIQRNQAQVGSWRVKLMRTPDHSIGLVKAYQKPEGELSLGIYPWAVDGPLCRIKSLCVWPRLLQQGYAREKGWDDVVCFDSQGYLTEGSFSNIFWISESKLFTPCTSLALLEGLGLKQVCRRATEARWEVNSVKIQPKNLPSNAFLYLCNSLTGPRPIRQIAGLGTWQTQKFESLLLAAKGQ